MADSKFKSEELKVNGQSLFAKWMKKLGKTQQAEVDSRIAEWRANGNLGKHRNLPSGVIELKFGSVLRVYGGKEGDTLFLLILGGDKNSQNEDIQYATEIWLAYTKSKAETDKKGKKK